MFNYKNRFKILKGGKISLIAGAILTSSTLCFAAPSGGVVTSGSATINQNGSVTNINQASQKASINWNSFSIAKSETVNFNQPNSSSITLNRVVGNETSVINGALNANGQVWILNSNGVLFGKNAKINTSGLLATTKNISDLDFQNANYSFSGDSTSSVVNQGTIEIDNSGYVVFASNETKNSGTIKAVKGQVHLIGANDYSINLNGNSMVGLTVDKGVLDALVENSGTIIADGGEIYLTTNAVDELLKGVVNNTGVLEANSIDDVTGTIELFAHGGEVQVGGIIEAKDGFVETSGKDFIIDSNTNIKAKTWLIDPTNLVIDDATAYNTALSNGTDQIIQTDAAGSDEGNIYINDEIILDTNVSLTLSAYNNIYINSDIMVENPSGILALYYGQGFSAASSSSDYYLSGVFLTTGDDDMSPKDPGNIVFNNGGVLKEKNGNDGVETINTFRGTAFVTSDILSNIEEGSTGTDGIEPPMSWKITPSDAHMMVLSPSSNAYMGVTSFSSLFKMTDESVASLNSDFPAETLNNTAGNYSIVYQDVELSDGQTMTLAWNYTSTDYADWNDGSFLSFVNTTNSSDHSSTIYGLNTEVMVLGATVEGTGNWSTKSYGSTGWQTATFKAGEAGTYRVGYAAFNLNDDMLSPFLVVDTEVGTTLKNGVNFEPLAFDENGPLGKSGVSIGGGATPSPVEDSDVQKVISTINNQVNLDIDVPNVVIDSGIGSGSNLGGIFSNNSGSSIVSGNSGSPIISGSSAGSGSSGNSGSSAVSGNSVSLAGSGNSGNSGSSVASEESESSSNTVAKNQDSGAIGSSNNNSGSSNSSLNSNEDNALANNEDGNSNGDSSNENGNIVLTDGMNGSANSEGNSKIVAKFEEGDDTSLVTLSQLQQNSSQDVVVPLGSSSMIMLVNGGVALPFGVDQEFYIVDLKKF